MNSWIMLFFQVIEPYKQVTNKLISLINEEAYRRKERLVEVFLDYVFSKKTNKSDVSFRSNTITVEYSARCVEDGIVSPRYCTKVFSSI